MSWAHGLMAWGCNRPRSLPFHLFWPMLGSESPMLSLFFCPPTAAPMRPLCPLPCQCPAHSLKVPADSLGRLPGSQAICPRLQARTGSPVNGWSPGNRRPPASKPFAIFEWSLRLFLSVPSFSSSTINSYFYYSPTSRLQPPQILQLVSFSPSSYTTPGSNQTSIE